MFRRSILLLIVLSFISCSDSKKNKKILSESTGRLTHLLVVCDQQNWDGIIGKSIRSVFSSSLGGLPNPEPIFTVSHLPNSVFSGFTKKNRLVLKINASDSSHVSIKQNVFARPQVLAELNGPSTQEILELLKSSKDEIIESFIAQEIKTRQSQIQQSLFDDTVLIEKFGVNMKLPSSYRLAKEEDNFVWLRSDLRTGTKDIVVYTAENSFENSTTFWVKKRDSIGRIYIPGPVKGSFMGTEDRYDPKIKTLNISGVASKELRGLWDMKNDVMSGPYLMYVLNDKKNNRVIIAEGYLYAPSLDKREYMLELEAILKSIKIKA